MNDVELEEIKNDAKDRKKKLKPDDKLLLSDEQKEFLLIDIDFQDYMYKNKKRLLGEEEANNIQYKKRLIDIFKYINEYYRPIEKIINDTKLITDKNAKNNLIKFCKEQKIITDNPQTGQGKKTRRKRKKRTRKRRLKKRKKTRKGKKKKKKKTRKRALKKRH